MFSGRVLLWKRDGEFFFCDISEFGICAQSRGADPDAAVFQRPGFPAFSSAVADCAEQKSRWPGDCLLSDLLQRRTFCDRVFPGRYYPGKCGDFVNFPVYQYFYRDCWDCAVDTGDEKKESVAIIDDNEIIEDSQETETDVEKITITDPVSKEKLVSRFIDVPTWDSNKLALVYNLNSKEVDDVFLALSDILYVNDNVSFTIENFATFKKDKGRIRCTFSENFAKQISEIKI